jgi:SAM-dependent methyltransferase/uncharacterized protein YbaR (Trm112 family)
MWSRAIEYLCCPQCAQSLRLHVFEEERVKITDEHLALARQRSLPSIDFDRFIQSGVLLCEACKTRFPIIYGLPVLVPYATPIHSEFASRFREQLTRFAHYGSPSTEPVPGEQFVMRSFSAEWLDYDYDGVIWDLSYKDHEERFLAELGPEAIRTGGGGIFLEIGCGIGLSTYFASKNMDCDAIGVDLSLAVLPAVRHFKTNPFLHFVQGSAFYLPVKRSLANVVYSHGVLHHTYSTKAALRSVASHCAPEGWLYVWLYGTESQRGSIARRIAFRLETAARPFIARNLSTWSSRATLGVLSWCYLVINRLHRVRNPDVEKYNYRKALHAARDRFTPLYAHRQNFPEVAGWLRELGFESVEQVDWRAMPSANQANYRRNTGVRGRRGMTAPA